MNENNTDGKGGGGASSTPMTDDYAKMMEQMTLQGEDVEIKLEMFTLYEDGRGESRQNYVDLLNDLYDEKSRKVALPSFPIERSILQDGGYKIVVHYALLPEEDEGDQGPADWNF